MSDLSSFCAFILTHGRPDNVRTHDTLRRNGYTGQIILVVDDEDSRLAEYQASFENVVVFSKRAMAARTQVSDNLQGRDGVVVFARNACFDIARDLGYRDFIQLDDDYTHFYHRFTGQDVFTSFHIKDLDSVFTAMLRFYRSTPFTSVAMLQGGDFLGGRYGRTIKLFRKAMNSFVCSTDRPFEFVGRINEDVNTYVSLGSRGHLFGSFNQLCLQQVQTQTSEGGMTGTYAAQGTYAKSFYTVLHHPSSVKVGIMHTVAHRIHHRINWKLTVPKIIPASFKKGTP